LPQGPAEDGYPLVAPDSPLWGERGDAALDVIVPSQWEPQTAFQAQYGPSGTDFAEPYTTKYNALPSYESAGAYACGLILQKAIEQAGETDTPKVAAALNATDITTFFGRTKSSTAGNEHGLQVGHAMVWRSGSRTSQGYWQSRWSGRWLTKAPTSYIRSSENFSWGLPLDLRPSQLGIIHVDHRTYHGRGIVGSIRFAQVDFTATRGTES